jgi:hypothetical protein
MTTTGFSDRYLNDPEYRAECEAFAAQKPPVTDEEIDWLRNTIRIGREQATRDRKAS